MDWQHLKARHKRISSSLQSNPPHSSHRSCNHARSKTAKQPAYLSQQQQQQPRVFNQHSTSNASSSSSSSL
jgi:hypothetical protein